MKPPSQITAHAAPHRRRHLPKWARLCLYAINLGAGVLPSLLFFAWVERNAALPNIPRELDWPWLVLSPELPMAASIIWDFALVLAFGLLHSLFAQSPGHRILQKLLPDQAIRTVYLAITGLSLLCVMGFWQHTGVLIWALPLPFAWNNGLSLFLFWGLMLVSGSVAAQFDALHFIGLRQIVQSSEPQTAGNPVLCTTGLFRYFRHPIYFFTLLAFLLAPIMSLDRTIVFAASALYLMIAIPYEERKLIALFGEAYVEYRKRVPAVIPFPRK